MAVILEEIVAVKKEEVAKKKGKEPLSALEEVIAGLPPPRDFRAALAAGRARMAVIAEFKRRSPSRGDIAGLAEPARVARLYEEGGAAALSVLTDERFFGGSFADLAAARGAVRLPVLRKDFIVDPWQIYETRAKGADALLLIAAILEEEELRQYRGIAVGLGMAALVEVHDEADLNKALAGGADLIGINNRDLRTFVTDARTSLALAPLVPAGKTVVAESGIKGREEIEALLAAGIRAVLVGEALMAASDPAGKIRELRGETG